MFFSRRVDGTFLERGWSRANTFATRLRTAAIQVNSTIFLIYCHFEFRKSSISLASGLNLEVTLTAAGSLDTAGQAEVSMWSQSADTKLEVEASVLVMMEAKIGDLLFVSSDVAASALLHLDSSIQMGGDETLACVRAGLQRGEARLEAKLGRRGEDEKSSQEKKAIPEMTINLGAKNNQMCNKMKV